MFDSFNVTFFNAPVLLIIAKTLLSLLLVCASICISYCLFTFLLWYHFSTRHPYEALVVYFTIASGLGVWYVTGMIYGKLWKHDPEK